VIPSCPVCDERRWDSILHGQAPLNTVTDLHGDGGDRRRMDYHLVRCAACGHLYNRAFDDGLVGAMYTDVPLTNVPVHPSMLTRLQDLSEWLDVDGLSGKNVVEIGCGSGHLARILAMRAAQVRLYEPNRNLRPEMLAEANIQLHQGLFTSDDARDPADLVICRQVLEHVADPLALLRIIRKALRPDGRVYLEVPDAAFIEAHASFSDLHQQHVQYFTIGNLIRLARAAGLHPWRVLSIKDGHDMGVLLQGEPRPDPLSAFPDRSVSESGLAARLAARLAATRRTVAGLRGRIALYGANAYGQSFFNATEGIGRYDHVFDDTQALIGRYGLFGVNTTLPIREPTPEALARCDSVIVCAYLHDTAICERIRGKGFSGRVLTIRPSPLPAGASALTSVYDA